MLPQKLDRGGIDVVLNGYEWSKEREQSWSSTIPYYIYNLQLLRAKTTPRFARGTICACRKDSRINASVCCAIRLPSDMSVRCLVKPWS